ncbi:hypothetical protein [Burkholderia ubonensis]|uniref:hypothetical protein n=1 Tax=Burkholderia ubonensis TaxID=101571 RepID=UPI000ADF8F94|nr:hypothetical protein [Burkholderia ubonensis]
MPQAHPERNILIATSNLQEDALLNLEFTWLHLPASYVTILTLLKNILEAEEQIRPVLDAWAASGDMNYDTSCYRSRRTGVRVWLTAAGASHDEFQVVAQNLAIENIRPDFVVANEAEARAVSNLLGR